SADPRNDFERDARRFKSIDLFSGAPEDSWITALESDHAHAFASTGDHEGMNCSLRNMFLSTALSDACHKSLRTGQSQDLLRYQVVMQHYVCSPEQGRCLSRQQFRIAWPGADEINFACL